MSINSNLYQHQFRNSNDFNSNKKSTSQVHSTFYQTYERKYNSKASLIKNEINEKIQYILYHQDIKIQEAPKKVTINSDSKNSRKK